MSVYKYTSYEVLEYILDGSIRMTPPSAFNDPFELLPQICLTYDDECDGEPPLKIDVCSDARSPNPARLADDFESPFSNDITARRLVEKLNETVGILCLSKNKDSLTMWSHYADQYKGVVIEFDDKHDFFAHMHNITYTKRRPKFNFSNLLLENETIRVSEICFKPKDWEYENEIRIFRPLNNCNKSKDKKGNDIYTMNIPLKAIKSIIIGERMPVEKVKNILKKLYNTHIAMQYALISNFEYNFDYELIKPSNTSCDDIISMLGIGPRSAHLFKDYPGELGKLARYIISEHPNSEFSHFKL